jgi:hypothetical protein
MKYRNLLGRVRTAGSSTPLPISCAWTRTGFKWHSRTHPSLAKTNYDLLLEVAFEAVGVPFFDGFVGVVSPFFVPECVDAQVPLRIAQIAGATVEHRPIVRHRPPGKRIAAFCSSFTTSFERPSIALSVELGLKVSLTPVQTSSPSVPLTAYTLVSTRTVVSSRR